MATARYRSGFRILLFIAVAVFLSMESRGVLAANCGPSPCNDHNPCTDDSCSSGRCVETLVVSCNDTNPCTDDVCNPARTMRLHARPTEPAARPHGFEYEPPAPTAERILATCP